MRDSFDIRSMLPAEADQVWGVIRRSFDEFVAPDFPPEGIEEFYRYARPGALLQRLQSDSKVLVAEQGGRIIGVLEILAGEHIAMLFVEDRGRGVGRRLVEAGLEVCREVSPDLRRLTVKSSRYAVPVYSRLGFVETGPEHTENGITYIPMALTIARENQDEMARP